jgi:hypothetical protein
MLRSEKRVPTGRQQARTLRTAATPALWAKARDCPPRRGNSRRRVVRLADTPGRVSEGQGLRLSARDAGNETILAWLSERGVRLEALGNERGAGRV